jgi:hypothetical protein
VVVFGELRSSRRLFGFAAVHLRQTGELIVGGEWRLGDHVVPRATGERESATDAGLDSREQFGYAVVRRGDDVVVVQRRVHHVRECLDSDHVGRRPSRRDFYSVPRPREYCEQCSDLR